MKSLHATLAASLLLAAVGCSDTGGTQNPNPPGNVSGSTGTSGASAGGSGSGGGGSSGVVPQAGSAGSPSSSGSGGTGVSAGGAGGAAGSGTGGLGTAGEGIVLTGDKATDLYNVHCSLCHGAQGVGGVLAPETQHPVRDYSTWVVRTGLPGKGTPGPTYVKPMDPIPVATLSDADLMLIFDYLDKPPKPTTAEALYHDYCGNCHGADGKGGPTTRDLTGTISHDFEDITREGTHPGMYDERNEYMPKFDTTWITDEQLQLIKDYVDTL
jgi:mono/diheme cytochrome c family protein